MKNTAIAKSIFGIIILIQISCSSNTLKGTWQYDGGIYDGKIQKASEDFKMQRTYTANQYEAYMIEGEDQPEKYASGTYEIKGDDLLLTGEYSRQPSQLVGKTISYKFNIEKQKLTLKGTLPNGMNIEEYWKKIK
ncbi:MAG: lipocalin family protein [Daejeonella sp.]